MNLVYVLLLFLFVLWLLNVFWKLTTRPIFCTAFVLCKRLGHLRKRGPQLTAGTTNTLMQRIAGFVKWLPKRVAFRYLSVGATYDALVRKRRIARSMLILRWQLRLSWLLKMVLRPFGAFSFPFFLLLVLGGIYWFRNEIALIFISFYIAVTLFEGWSLF